MIPIYMKQCFLLGENFLPNFEKEEKFAIFPFFSENLGIYQVLKNQK
jgi:hypothetical protein